MPWRRLTAFVCAIASPELVVAGDICYRVNPDSPIDQRFLSKLENSGIQYKKELPDLACISPSARAVASELRDAAHTELPQECVSFDERGNYAILRAKLRADNLMHWMEKSEGPLCYLRTDSVRVHRVIMQTFKGKHEGAGAV